MSTFLTIVASIGAATFGMLALLTDFRDTRNQISSRARFVILGIGAAALLTIVADYASKMESSLEAADRQRLLIESIWRANSRIETANFSAVVQYSFDYPYRREPAFFETGWKLVVVASKNPHLERNRNAWGMEPLLKNPEMRVEANFQNIRYRSRHTVDDIQWQQTTTFSGFTGELGGFSAPSTWNGAAFEAVLSASGWSSMEDRFDPIRKPRWEASKAFSEYYSVPKYFTEESDANIAPMGVRAKLTFYVRDRPVVSAVGWPALVTEWDEDVRGLRIVKFPIVTIAENTFDDPTRGYNQDRKREDAIRIALLAAGFGLVVALVIAGVGYYLKVSAA